MGLQEELDWIARGLPRGEDLPIGGTYPFSHSNKRFSVETPRVPDCDCRPLVLTATAPQSSLAGLGQPVFGALVTVGSWQPSRVNGARQTLVRVSGESPSISRQIKAPAAKTSAPSATQIELIARGQRNWTASSPVSSIRRATWDPASPLLRSARPLDG